MPKFDAKSYWESRLSKDWGLHGVGYAGYGTAFNRWLYRVRRRVFLREVRRLKLDWAKTRVLDVGSGTGFYLDAWRSLGVGSLSGCDFTSVAVKQLQAQYPECHITQLDIGSRGATAALRGETFDLISAFDVLFHIVDDRAYRQALLNIAQLIRMGGYFLFSDNFLHGKTVRSEHQVSRSLEEIEAYLEEAGLQIMRRVPMFFFMNAPLDVLARWPLLLWRAAMAPVHLLPLLGHVYGALLFPLEVLLTGTLNESPSTEMVLCRKANDSATKANP